MTDRVAQAALLVVAAALVDSRGRILVQRRPASRQHGGLWEFPGGKVEPGEGPVEALIREIAEELAIAVTAEDCVPLGFSATEPASGSRPVVLLLYGCCNWRGNPVNQEGADIAWCDAAALAALGMPPLDVPLVPLATRFADGHDPGARSIENDRLENVLPSPAHPTKCASPRRP